MILIDTSVLIDFLSGGENNKVNKLTFILENNIPYGINSLIYVEILQGAKDKKEFNILKEYLASLHFYFLKNRIESYEKAAKIYFKCRKNGITIRSTIDSLIMQTAIENNLFLLHNDKDFSNASKIIKELKEY